MVRITSTLAKGCYLIMSFYLTATDMFYWYIVMVTRSYVLGHISKTLQTFVVHIGLRNVIESRNERLQAKDATDYFIFTTVDQNLLYLCCNFVVFDTVV